MCFSKNKLLILVLVLLVISLVGCRKKMTNQIEVSEILEQEEDEYYVYFYKYRCPYCEACEDTINNYINNGELKLYTCDLTFDKIIKKENDGDDIYNVNGVTSYEDLRIPKVPTLIKINTINSIKTAEYITSGKTKVIDYISNQNIIE